MLSATFVGEVQQGRLHIGEPLLDFEGKQVLVILVAADAPFERGRASVPVPRAALEAELLEDAGRILVTPGVRHTVTAQVIAIGPKLSSGLVRIRRAC